MAVVFFPPAGEVIRCKKSIKRCVKLGNMKLKNTSMWESDPKLHFTASGFCAGQEQFGSIPINV